MITILSFTCKHLTFVQLRAENRGLTTVYISPRALVVTVFIYKLLILFEETFLRTILSQRWEDRTINNKLPRQDNVLF